MIKLNYTRILSRKWNQSHHINMLQTHKINKIYFNIKTYQVVVVILIIKEVKVITWWCQLNQIDKIKRI
jgi:hypothetical protein